LSDELLEAREEAKMSAASDREKALHDEIQKASSYTCTCIYVVCPQLVVEVFHLAWDPRR